ncbi:MAG: hypothetical protein IJ608_12380 [Lachnospiraceae bacterium]|nr:hypothetical protein [Lachnospiraceae bacterium]
MYVKKGLVGFLNDDSSLLEETTLEEFETGKVAPDNSDDDIEDAYRTYCRIMKKPFEEVKS